MLSRKQIGELLAKRSNRRNRLADAIGIAGVTQEQLAEAIGVSQAYVSKLCTGTYGDLPLEKTRAIAEFFGCSIEDLFPSKSEVA